MSEAKRVLRMHLKREYWEQIRDGRKSEEYRLATEYWTKRLANREYDEIHLVLGYPKSADESRTLRRKWRGFVRKTITHKHFGDEPVDVFAIDVSEVAK